MRIVYLGNFKYSWCTENYVTADARRIPGVGVMQIQEPNQIVSPTHWARFAATVATACDGADLLIYQRTWGLPPEAIDLWRTIEERGCKTISYHLDKYVGLQREAGIDGDPFWATGVVFSADGDPYTQQVLTAKGIDHRWLPPAIASSEAYIAEPKRVHPAPDVVFVGSSAANYHPEHQWRAVLLDGLTERYGDQFFRWPTEQRGRLHGAALNAFYASARVTVGDTLALPGTSLYVSDRLFESLGRGAVLAFPRVPGIEKAFDLRDGEHLRYYDIGDFDGLASIIDDLLAHPDEARAMARRGHEAVRARHTYTDRVRTMMESLGLQ